MMRSWPLLIAARANLLAGTAVAAAAAALQQASRCNAQFTRIHKQAASKQAVNHILRTLHVSSLHFQNTHLSNRASHSMSVRSILGLRTAHQHPQASRQQTTFTDKHSTVSCNHSMKPLLKTYLSNRASHKQAASKQFPLRKQPMLYPG
jgi:hypothetical protein